MTREELDFIGSMNMFDEISNEAYKKIVCHCEEQEPCEDAISRQAAICKIANSFYAASVVNADFEECEKMAHMMIDDIPPVTPQYTDVEIQKMQDLEQAEIKKAYELGKAEPKTGHWIRMKAYEKWGCSECSTVFRFTFKEHNYCPNCGAKMEAEE